MRVLVVIKILFLFSQVAMARGLGMGEKVSNPPDAVCRLMQLVKGTLKPACSGTIIKGDPAKFFTNGHCVGNIPRQDFQVECGCKKNKCKETFKFHATNPDIEIKIPKAENDPYEEDHALLKLDHAPKLVEAVDFGIPADYIDLETGKLRTDVKCIKGGFGASLKSLAMSDTPLMVDVPELKKLAGITATSSLQLMADVLGQMSVDEHTRQMSCTEIDNAQDERRFLYQRSFIRNSLMDGDSGGPLLCRLGNNKYVLVGNYSGGGDFYKGPSKKELEFDDIFRLINPSWINL